MWYVMRGGYIEVCRYAELSVMIPKGYFFAFANSPYYCHKRLSAVDVYPPIGSSEFLAPFSGKLVFYKVVRGEHIAGFVSEEGYYVRILHLKPRMEPGENFSQGDVLGELVWSPTFYPWTVLHAHLEVRRGPEFVRARGCLSLELGAHVLKLVEESSCVYTSMLRAKIVEIKPFKYVLARVQTSNITPLTARSSGHCGFIEGGIPYYGHAIVYAVEKLVHSSAVECLGSTIGYIDFERDIVHHVVLDGRLKVYAGDFVVRGVGVYSGTNVVKIVPVRWKGIDLREGDEIVLRVESEENR